MAQATLASIPQADSVQQAAAAIVRLINSSPRSPRIEEIEAILARAMPSVRSDDDAIVRRWEAAEAAHYAVAIRNGESSDEEHSSANDALIEATRRLWREPVKGWPDIVARAKVAFYWKWPRFDPEETREYEALVREADDLDDGPLALLVHAILEGGRQLPANLGSGVAPATPLLMEIRETVTHLSEAFDVQGKVHPADKAADKAAQARIDKFQEELDELEDQIASPPQTFGDLLAWAEIARSGADLHTDGTMGEAEEDDVFLRPAARLIEAVLQFGGAAPMTAMSPAHAAHYQEWRRLIDTHVREFGTPDHAVMTAGEIEEEEARMGEHLDRINKLTKKILKVSAQTWADIRLFAELCFWHSWSIDAEAPDARAQLQCAPASIGELPDLALSKLLGAIFTVAGVGQFAEVEEEDARPASRTEAPL
jgi:hypothetical protein